MLSNFAHELMKDTCDTSRVIGERLQVWHAFMNRMYELDRQKERKPEVTNFLSTELNEKRLVQLAAE